MLNIFKKKQKNFSGKSLNTINNINNEKNTQINIEKDEHKNIIYYPSSSKE
jgi:hypothetical protein